MKKTGSDGGLWKWTALKATRIIRERLYRRSRTLNQEQSLMMAGEGKKRTDNVDERRNENRCLISG